MGFKFQAYPKYKKADNFAWFEDVPSHWGIFPNRKLFFEVAQRERPEDEMLSVTIAKGVIRQSSLLANTSKKDSSKSDKSMYKSVLPGDVVYNKMRAWQNAIGVSRFQGIVSPAYVVLRLLDKSNFSRYFHYLFRTASFAMEARRWSYGIVPDMWSFRPEHFKLVYVPVPPPDEQAAIARFLDWANGKIDGAIAEKEKLLPLLAEQRQAVIHRAVTRGLDSSVSLKPSGIAWLGNVPNHWEVTRLHNSIASIVNGIWGDDPDGNNDICCVRVADFDRQRFRVFIDNPTIRAVPDYLRERYMIKTGDLLLEKSGGGDKQPVGVVVLYNQNVPAVCSNFVARIRNKNEFYPEFLVLLYSVLYGLRINTKSIKQTTGIQNIDTYSYLSEKVAFPPYQEQKDIAKYLNDVTAKIDAAIASTRREIKLLREYRARLISDAVTGKIDVRGLVSPAKQKTEKHDNRHQ